MKFILVVLTALSLTATAQEIRVGDYFNNVGSLRNPSTEWKTNEFPFKLVLMYNNGKTTINGNAMFFRIEAAPEVGIEPDEQKIVVGQGRSWAAFKYDFQAPGKYTITTYDREHTLLATASITIEGPKKPEPKPEPVEPEKPVEQVVTKKAELTKEAIIENAPEPVFVEPLAEEELTEEEKETLVFESFYIAFGRTVQSGMLMGQNEKFKGVPGGVDLQVLFSNNEGFGTETIAVEVWYRPQGGKEYDTMVKEMTVPIGKGVTQANFPLNLRDRGSYKVSLYTGGDDPVWIGSGYAAIY
ncbi:MAG: hypothetical protein GC178_13000 [Flavobacteriales bacterium]|nr:hypothetical protein [Flavobacteriales bacterium]